MKRIFKSDVIKYGIFFVLGAIIFTALNVTAETIVNKVNSEHVVYKEGTVKQALDDLLSREASNTNILDAYPVGSIYISATDTNPSTLFGGTWERFGQGRTLIGEGTGTDTNSISQSFIAGSTGGEYKHTLTVDEIPSHSHTIMSDGFKPEATHYEHFLAPVITGFGTNDKSYTTEATGGGASHNNIQPYIVVYMWKRTA